MATIGKLYYIHIDTNVYHTISLQQAAEVVRVSTKHASLFEFVNKHSGNLNGNVKKKHINEYKTPDVKVDKKCRSHVCGDSGGLVKMHFVNGLCWYYFFQVGRFSFHLCFWHMFTLFFHLHMYVFGYSINFLHHIRINDQVVWLLTH